MEPINHSLLRQIKQDNNAKKTPAKRSGEAMLQFFYSKKNLFYLVRDNMTLFELGLWIKSITNYVYRKNRSNIQHNANKREVVLIDYGMNVGDDVSYEHPGVVIARKHNSVLVVPCSTGKLRNAYDQNGEVKDGYLIGEVPDGFSKQTAIVLYNAKWISKHSIINNRGDKITKDFFDKITKEIQKLSLNELYLESEKQGNTITKLDEKNTRLKEILKGKNEKILEQEKALKDKDKYIQELEKQIKVS